MTTKTIRYALILSLLAPTLQTAGGSGLADFIAKISSTNENKRLEARLTAPRHSAAAIVPLGALLRHDDISVRTAAREAMERIVHHTGRPGGVEERGAVCAALVKLTAPERSPLLKREAAHFLGFIAGDHSVPAVARLLGDADRRVAETARLALERIPGAAAINALADALKGVPDRRKADFLYSLSKKGGDRAVAILLQYAGPGSPPLRLAALEGLARLGSKTAIPLFEKAIEAPDGINVEHLYRKYLVLAEVLREQVDAAAAAIFRVVLARAPAGYLREHAVLGLCPPGSATNVDVLVTALADPSPRVKRLTRRHLALLQSAEIMPRLMAAYRSAAREVRPGILRILAERDRDAVSDIVEEAARSADTALGVTALDILDRLEQPELESTYLELAEHGLEGVRSTAVKGYLLLAKRQLAAGNENAAFAMCRRVLESLPAASVAHRRLAIQGVVESGEFKGLDVLAGLLGDGLLANDAARGTTRLAGALGETGKKERAAGYLRPIVTGKFPPEIIQGSARGLKKLGFDPEAQAKAGGFVLDWMLTTPIRDEDGTGIKTAFFPETLLGEDREMGFEKVHQIGARRVRWRTLDALSSDGTVNLKPLYRRTAHVLIYAYAELSSHSDRDVLLKIGSNDRVACWLNKKRVHLHPTPRTLTIDQDVVRARLHKGKNRLLLKVTQEGGEWGFALRITDPDGKPIDSRTLTRG